VVAVAATFLGATGTAVASGSADRLTTAKVKRIAGSVVERRASKLVVAHAGSADVASDAQALGGRPPSDYLDQVAFGAVTAFENPVGIGGQTQLLGPLTISVPAGVGFVHVTGTATFGFNNADLHMWFSQDGTCLDDHQSVGKDNYAGGQSTTSGDQVTVDFVSPVSPGAHTFRLCAQGASSQTKAYQRTLSVETVASSAG
jgi:hypothetical protein